MQFKNSQFIEVQGLKCRIRQTGSGEPVLLLHGLNSALHTWDAWHDLLPNYHVISLDLPGFGYSGYFQGDYGVDRYLTFLKELLSKIEVDRLHVVGNSFGGLLAWNLALQTPDKVKSLVLIDSTGYKRDSLPINYKFFLWPVFRLIAHRVTPKSMVKKALLKVCGHADKVTQTQIDLYHQSITNDANRAAFTQVLKSNYCPMPNYVESIKKINCPTLILWGERDQIIPVTHAMRFAKDIAVSECIIYEGIGHIPMEEHAQQSAQDTDAFLKQHPFT